LWRRKCFYVFGRWYLRDMEFWQNGIKFWQNGINFWRDQRSSDGWDMKVVWGDWYWEIVEWVEFVVVMRRVLYREFGGRRRCWWHGYDRGWG
jgi:hypothetical protein